MTSAGITTATTTPPTSHVPALASVPSPDEVAGALAGRLLESTIGAFELLGVYLGRRLGLYDCLRAAASTTPAELAARAGIDERYAREWLEQQAVAGFLTVEEVGDDLARGASERRYALPEAHAVVLIEDEHPALTGPVGEMLVGVASAMPDVLDAFRSGAGVPYERYGADFRRGQGAMNRPVFAHDLTGAWLPQIADLHARLAADPPARIADVGCGVGWSTIALARAYPRARVTGYDLDQGSIVEASANASDAGVSVSFARKDAGAVAADGPFELVLIFQALHDMSRPTEVLATLRGALAPGGSVLVVDHRVADAFVAPGDAAERLIYGFSTVHCLPVSLTEQPSEAIGTVIRCCTVERCAREAGFARFEALAIDSPLYAFYRLRA